MMEELEVSRATIIRDLEYLRGRDFRAPIVWDREVRGYRYQRDLPDGARFHLPGLWFNTSEAHALLTMSHLLKKTEPGLLSEHIAPLQARLAAILEHGGHEMSEINRRIRIISMAARPAATKHLVCGSRRSAPGGWVTNNGIQSRRGGVNRTALIYSKFPTAMTVSL